MLGGPPFRSWWCVRTDAVVAEQGGVVVVWLVLLLPDSELVTGESLMLGRPLQEQTGGSQVHVTDSVTVRRTRFSRVQETHVVCVCLTGDLH